MISGKYGLMSHSPALMTLEKCGIARHSPARRKTMECKTREKNIEDIAPEDAEAYKRGISWNSAVRNVRMIWAIIKRVNFDEIVIGFFICFFVFPLIIKMVEPGINTYGDAIWYLFVSCTTIGFGDFAAVTFVGRMLTVIMTVYEILLVAMLAGVVVSIYLEVAQKRQQETATVFLDKMTHLTELSPEELAEIETKAKKLYR